MTAFFHICYIPHSTSKRLWNLPVTSFSIHIATQIMSCQHHFTSDPIHIVSNWSWKLPVTSFTINIALQIRSRQHILTSAPIYIAPKLGHDSILSDLLQCIYYLKLVVKTSFHILSTHIPPQTMLSEHPFISVPFHEAPLIWSWQLPFTSFPIHITPQIISSQHRFTFVPIHIVTLIGRQIFLSHHFQST
jgi:hypothetical protein